MDTQKHGAHGRTHVHTHALARMSSRPGVTVALPHLPRQDTAQRQVNVSRDPSRAHGTYHHIVDVVCFPQSHFLAFFAFSMFVFCKHNTQEMSVHHGRKA